MMLRPRWPSAGPIGGDGLADPAGTCNLRYPVIFFAITLAPVFGPLHAGRVQGSWCGSRRLAAAITCHGFRGRTTDDGGRMRQELAPINPSVVCRASSVVPLIVSRPDGIQARPAWRGRKSIPRP